MFLLGLARVDRECPRCDGLGRVETLSFADPTKTIDRPCHVCDGAGILKG